MVPVPHPSHHVSHMLKTFRKPLHFLSVIVIVRTRAGPCAEQRVTFMSSRSLVGKGIAVEKSISVPRPFFPSAFTLEKKNACVNRRRRHSLTQEVQLYSWPSNAARNDGRGEGRGVGGVRSNTA